MNMNLDNKLSEDIFFRIRLISKIKKIVSSQYITLVILLISVGYTSFVVSVVDVYVNTVNHHGFIDGILYFFDSLLNSQIIVQVLASLTLIATIRLSFPILKRMTPNRIFSRRVV